MAVVHPAIVFNRHGHNGICGLLGRVTNNGFVVINTKAGCGSVTCIKGVIRFVGCGLGGITTNCRICGCISGPSLGVGRLITRIRRDLGGGVPSIRLPCPLKVLNKCYFSVLDGVANGGCTIDSIHIGGFYTAARFSTAGIRSSNFITPCALSRNLSQALRCRFIRTGGSSVAFISRWYEQIERGEAELSCCCSRENASWVVDVQGSRWSRWPEY